MVSVVVALDAFLPERRGATDGANEGVGGGGMELNVPVGLDGFGRFDAGSVSEEVTDATLSFSEASLVEDFSSCFFFQEGVPLNTRFFLGMMVIDNEPAIRSDHYKWLIRGITYIM